METGMLSCEEFERGALRFASVWREHSSTAGIWSWRQATNGLDAGYLAMEGALKQSASAHQQSDACLALGALLDDEDVGEEEGDCAVLCSTAGAPPVHLYDYHICYHASYSVPVLFFRGSSRADGAALCWEEVLEDLPAASRELASTEDSQWTFITQQEHPVLRHPWAAGERRSWTVPASQKVVR
ncbi:hypothetical protein WJX75_003609 [Coccomyxa subellipsoidea]|uniref:Ubiquitin-like-conjugating enzyme ATG10 n=1 Tax=Coccomyxa subellipsoidea TaxID=248742 RepID=A0ABR2YHX2_9CHLO